MRQREITERETERIRKIREKERPNGEGEESGPDLPVAKLGDAGKTRERRRCDFRRNRGLKPARPGRATRNPRLRPDGFVRIRVTRTFPEFRSSMFGGSNDDFRRAKAIYGRSTKPKALTRKPDPVTRQTRFFQWLFRRFQWRFRRARSWISGGHHQFEQRSNSWWILA